MKIYEGRVERQGLYEEVLGAKVAYLSLLCIVPLFTEQSISGEFHNKECTITVIILYYYILHMF